LKNQKNNNMAETTSLVRTVVATNVQEHSQAEFNGWALQFTVNKDGNEVKSIIVNGQKGQASMSASIGENGYTNIGYSAGTRDSALTVAILDELDIIMADQPVEE